MKERYNKYYLVVIADYNDDDAHGIVHDNLYYWFDQHDLTILEFDRVDVKPFNTVQTGYILARRALNPLSPSARQVFLVNTAPRMDDPGERDTNEGEGLVQARLRSNKLVYAVNSGYALSFLKPEIQSLHVVNIPSDTNDIPILAEALRTVGSERCKDNVGVGQFRSGYIYPIVLARSLAGLEEPITPQFGSLIGGSIDVTAIPDIPESIIVFRDGYGNLKVSIQPESLSQHFGEFAVVASQGQEIIAHIRPGIFDVPVHHFSFAPGSTILAYSEGSRRQFAEVALRGGHAAKALSRSLAGGDRALPAEGDTVEWRLAIDDDFRRLRYQRDGTPPDDVLSAALTL